MKGCKIETVQKGLKYMISELGKDPMAMETAFLSVITFGTEVEQVVPLTDVFTFTMPELKAGGRTYLGKALEFVTECAENEVQKNTAETKGDWKPLVFIFTDGGSTDSLPGKIKKFNTRKWAQVVACAAGEKAHIDELKKITESVVKIDDDEASIASFFKWVSSSVSVSSASVGANQGELTSFDRLPPPPEEFQIF